MIVHCIQSDATSFVSWNTLDTRCLRSSYSCNYKRRSLNKYYHNLHVEHFILNISMDMDACIWILKPLAERGKGPLLYDDLNYSPGGSDTLDHSCVP